MIAFVPFDTRLAAQLRNSSGLSRDDALVILDGKRIIASSPPVFGFASLKPGTAQVVTIGGARYRALGAGSLDALIGEIVPSDIQIKGPLALPELEEEPRDDQAALPGGESADPTSTPTGAGKPFLPSQPPVQIGGAAPPTSEPGPWGPHGCS